MLGPEKHGSPHSVVRLIDRNTSEVMATRAFPAVSESPLMLREDSDELDRGNPSRLAVYRSTTPSTTQSPALTLRCVSTPVPGSVNDHWPEDKSDTSSRTSSRLHTGTRTYHSVRTFGSIPDSENLSTLARDIELSDGWFPNFSHTLQWASIEDLGTTLPHVKLPVGGVVSLVALQPRPVDRFSQFKQAVDQISGASVSYGTLAQAGPSFTAFRWLPFIERPKSYQTINSSSVTLSPRTLSSAPTPQFTQDNLNPRPSTPTTVSSDLRDGKPFRRYPCPK